MKKLFLLMLVLSVVSGCSSMSERVISEANPRTAGCAVEADNSNGNLIMPSVEK